MPRHEWIASLLIVLHLVAITVAAIPDPLELNIIEQVPQPTEDPTARVLMPLLQRGARLLSSMEPKMFTVTQPLRSVTRPYIRMGLRQQWNMFASPLPVDQYVRLDYYVSSTNSASPRRIFQELVLPADREDRVRFVHQFRDKAVLNAVETYFRNLGLTSSSDSLPRDFVPLIRYFGARFASNHLRNDEQVARTDLWIGTAAIPPRGQTVPPDLLRQRLGVLSKYFEGPVGVTASIPYPKRGSGQRQADIFWTLEYTDEP